MCSCYEVHMHALMHGHERLVPPGWAWALEHAAMQHVGFLCESVFLIPPMKNMTLDKFYSIGGFPRMCQFDATCYN